EAALARGEGLPQWVRQGRHVLIWSTVLGFIATFLWSRGWLPFVDTRIDSIWPVAAVGLSAVIQSGWSWIVRRHERKTRTGQAVKALSLPCESASSTPVRASAGSGARLSRRGLRPM